MGRKSLRNVCYAGSGVELRRKTPMLPQGRRAAHVPRKADVFSDESARLFDDGEPASKEWNITCESACCRRQVKR